VYTERFIPSFANLLPLAYRARHQPVFTSSQTGKLPLKNDSVKLLYVSDITIAAESEVLQHPSTFQMNITSVTYAKLTFCDV
jgi:hypothetical protein